MKVWILPVEGKIYESFSDILRHNFEFLGLQKLFVFLMLVAEMAMKFMGC